MRSSQFAVDFGFDPGCHFWDCDSGNIAQLSVFAVVSCPAAIKVRMFDRTSASVVAGAGLERLEQAGQEIVRRQVRLLRQKSTSPRDHPVDFGLEEFEGRAHPKPAEPRNELGHAEL